MLGLEGPIGDIVGTLLKTVVIPATKALLIKLIPSAEAYLPEEEEEPQKLLKSVLNELGLLRDESFHSTKQIYDDAIIELQHENFKAANDEFKNLGKKARKAFNLVSTDSCDSKSNEAISKWIFLTEMRIVAEIMAKLTDGGKLKTIDEVDKIVLHAIATKIKHYFDDLLNKADTIKTAGLVEAQSMIPIWGKKKLKQYVDETLKVIDAQVNKLLFLFYPLLQKGLQDMETGFSLKVFPKYIPSGEKDKMKIELGNDQTISMYKNLDELHKGIRKEGILHKDREILMWSLSGGTENALHLKAANYEAGFIRISLLMLESPSWKSNSNGIGGGGFAFRPKETNLRKPVTSERRADNKRGSKEDSDTKFLENLSVSSALSSESLNEDKGSFSKGI